MEVKTIKFEAAYNRQKDRMQQFINYFPFPALIAFGLVFFISIFLLPKLNPRLGQPAQLLELNVEEKSPGSMWLSLTVEGEQVTVSTDDRKIFTWEARLENLEPLSRFKSHLEQQIRHRASTATFSTRAPHNYFQVVIAADQRARYLHVRPLLNIFAELGITKYGFETLTLANSDSQNGSQTE